MEGVKMEPLLLNKWLIKSLVVAKLQLAFWCNCLWKVLKLGDIYVKLAVDRRMTGPNVTQRM